MTAPTLALDLPDTWAYGAGVLHGGWLLETIVTEALRATAHPHPVAVSAHYASAGRVGPADLDVELLREGRSVASLRAQLSQGGEPKISALVTAGQLPAARTTPLRLSAVPPQMPLPEDCVRHEMPAGLPRNGILEQLEIRLDPATAAWTQGSFGGGTEVRAWVRSGVGREVDPLMLLTVADALPPVTLDLGIPGWTPTLELTVYLRAMPVQGWLRCVQRARLVAGGWLDEECEVWDSAGHLVVQARQLAGYREPAA